MVLAAMARGGVAGVAVGERDLALGLDWLVREGRAAGVPLLAANLRAADGSRPFASHRLVEVDGRRVGVLAVVGGELAAAGLVVEDPAAAATGATAALRSSGATVVVALLHMPVAEARRILEAGLDVEVAVVAHEGRRRDPAPAGRALLASPTDRGRDLLSLEIALAPQGPWADVAAPRKAREEREAAERWIAIGQERLARATPGDRQAIEEFLALQRERAADAGRRERLRPEGRLFELRHLPLATELPEDPEFAPEVERVLERFGQAPEEPGP